VFGKRRQKCENYLIYNNRKLLSFVQSRLHLKVFSKRRIPAGYHSRIEEACFSCSFVHTTSYMHVPFEGKKR